MDIKQLEDEILSAPGQWFVVNCQNGHEEKVKIDLLSRISSDRLQNEVFDVKVALTKVKVSKISKNGQKIETIKEKNKFPGYIFINMNMSEKTWFIVRNNPGVTGFIGSSGRGAKPFPLSVDEVIDMLSPEEEIIIEENASPEEVEEKNKGIAIPKKELFTANFNIGDYVKVNGGIHDKSEGFVQDMDYSKGIAIISIEMFGRYTALEVHFDQVEKFDN